MAYGVNRGCYLRFARDPNLCIHPLECQMDIYYDNRIQMPWTHPEVERDNMWLGLDSSRFIGLHPESRIRRYADFDGVIKTGGVLEVGEAPVNSGVHERVASFDKAVAPGVAMISYLGDGVCPKSAHVNSEKVVMRFWGKRDSLKNESAMMHEIVFPKPYMNNLWEAYKSREKEKSEWKGLVLKKVFGEQKN